MNSWKPAFRNDVSESSSSWKENRKGGEKAQQRRKKYIYIYILTVISRIHRPSPRSWSVNRRPILRPILVHRGGGLANSIGERKRRCETCTRLAYEFPLKRFRYRFRGSRRMSRSLLSFLLLPRRERKRWMKPVEREEEEIVSATNTLYTWLWRGLRGMITRGWLWFGRLRVGFDCRVFEEERGWWGVR